LEKVVKIIIEQLLFFYDNGNEFYKKGSYGEFIIKNGNLHFIDTDDMKYTYTCSKDFLESDELSYILDDLERILESIEFNCDFKIIGTKNN